MRAVLWNGHKQLDGELEIRNHKLCFELLDFEDTDLQLSIPLKDIEKISLKKVYRIAYKAISIQSTEGKTNVFVVDNVDEVKTWLETQIKLFNKPN
jgi:hypothetical protein